MTIPGPWSWDSFRTRVFVYLYTIFFGAKMPAVTVNCDEALLTECPLYLSFCSCTSLRGWWCTHQSG